jgi:hypothetical protein
MRGMGLVMSVVLVVMAIIPILPPPGRCWGPTPLPGWHGKPPIWLPQIIICNFLIHGQPVLPTYPPHPIPMIVKAPPQLPGGCNSLYCWVNQ